jgi:hypothetical protein
MADRPGVWSANLTWTVVPVRRDKRHGALHVAAVARVLEAENDRSRILLGRRSQDLPHVREDPLGNVTGWQAVAGQLLVKAA